jgi:hypothetical protein
MGCCGRWGPAKHIPRLPASERRCTGPARAELPEPRSSRPGWPAWCGQCDERTRLLDYDGDAPRPCPSCRGSASGGRQGLLRRRARPGGVDGRQATGAMGTLSDLDRLAAEGAPPGSPETFGGAAGWHEYVHDPEGTAAGLPLVRP